jgi:hypothetical protein
MLGNKVLAKTAMKVTEEGAKQFAIVTEEVTKLANVTGRYWCLTEAKLFDKVRKISFGQGFICGGVVTGIVAAKHNKKKTEETKPDEE